MKDLKPYLFLIILGIAFYLPFLGGVHLFDWDEVNFAEVSREMIETGDYLKVQVNYRPFYEKPPLFFWLQVVSMKIFGVNEFAARFPNAIVGIITLIILFHIGRKLFNKRFGLIWSLAYVGSVLPHIYFKSGIIDPLFNLFIFLGIYYFLKFKWKKDMVSGIYLDWPGYLYLLISGLFIGLSMLTKGPVAYLIVLLTFGIYLVTQKFRPFISIIQFLIFGIMAVLVMGVWFGLEIIKNGPEFIIEFVTYQVRLFSTADSGHGGFPGFHVIVLLLGCFPASVFAIRGFYHLKPEKGFQQDFRNWMIILFWVVLVLFSIVQSKIMHYSSLCYFPLTFLAALSIQAILNKKIKFNKWMKSGVISIGLLFVLITIIAPFAGKRISQLKPLFGNNVDTMATLEANVNWTGWEAIPGLIILITLFVFFYMHNKEKIYSSFKVLFLGTAIMIFAGLICYIGRIEMYTQNALVEFCKTLEGKEGYVKTSGFKSYIHHFYSKRLPPVHEKSDDIAWLTWEEVDKDVYIIGKKHVENHWQGIYTVKQTGDKNGYVFFKRLRQQTIGEENFFTPE